MATGTYTPFVPQQYFDNSGNPLSAGSIETFIAGTTTHLATFSDVNLTVQNANPMTLDAGGRPQAGYIFLTPGLSYKFLIKDVTGSTMATPDNILAIPPSSATLDITGVAGETLTAGQVVYLSDGSGARTAGQWFKADNGNSYSSISPEIGVVPFTIASGASGSIRLLGLMTGLSSLTPGTIYYVGTNGGFTATKPTNSRIIGQADSTTSLVIIPNPPFATDTFQFSPTWGNTGTANSLGNGTLNGTYLQIGKLVVYTINLTIGSTTTIGSGAMTLTVPVASPGLGPQGNTSVIMFHSGSGTFYRGNALNSSVTVFVLVDNASPMASVTATNPFTWATGDTIQVTGIYFAA
jgi:hypothetical protein